MATTEATKVNNNIQTHEVKPIIQVGKNLKIGLALGGGGSLGLAHIGVLKVLEENGIKFTHIVGTSMGSIVGAFYAAGFGFNEMRQIALKIQGYQLIDINLSGRGLISGRNVEKILSKYISPETKFSDLKIKFACNAVSLSTGKEVFFNSGNLINAIRASSCVPGVFAPVKYGEEYLVDGGIINNVADDYLKDKDLDYIIAVDVVNKIETTKPIKTVSDVVYFSALLALIEQRRLKPKVANIEIHPQVHKFRQYHFNKKVATSVIELGMKAAQEMMPEILKQIKKIELAKKLKKVK